MQPGLVLIILSLCQLMPAQEIFLLDDSDQPTQVVWQGDGGSRCPGQSGQRLTSRTTAWCWACP